MELERNIEDITTQNNKLQEELAIALEVKPSKKSKQ